MIMQNLPLMIAVVTLYITPAEAASTISRGNVVFDQVKEVSISHTSWKVTYIIDLSVYDNLFQESFKHLSTVATELWDIMNAQHSVSQLTAGVDFGPQYRMIYKRLQQVNDTKDRLMETLEEYKSLRPRTERSLLPFVGEIYSFLFGVETEASLNDVRSALNTLSNNQQTVKHVVNESLTLISNTHEKVRENRDKINGIVDKIKIMKDSIKGLAEDANQVTKSIITFLAYYSQLTIIADDMQELATEAMGHIQDLSQQLDMASLGAITPSLVGPLHLREILREISKKLPSNLFIPINPKKHLWEFYQRITCSSAFDKSHILIFLDIPLGNYQDSYDIIKVHNMPLPNTDMFGPRISTTSKAYNPRQMVALYDLEVGAFAIERARGRYVLLTPSEAEDCLKRDSGFCEFKSPVYSVGPEPRSCVISLFLNNEAKARKVCKTIVKPNHILPQAENVAEGQWLVSTLHPFVFTITCRPRTTLKRGKTYTQKIKPPLQSVTLPPNCAANSEFITLPPYYDLKSVVRFKPNIEDIFVNKTFELWTPLFDKLPTFNDSWDIKGLEKMDEMNMDDLIKELDTVNKVHVDLKHVGWGWKEWLFLAAGIIVGLVILSWVIKNKTGGFTFLLDYLSKDSPGRHPPTSPEPEEIPLKSLPPSAPAVTQEPTKMVMGSIIHNPVYTRSEDTTFKLHPLEIQANKDEATFKLHPLETPGDGIPVTEVPIEKKQNTTNFSVYPTLRP